MVAAGAAGATALALHAAVNLRRLRRPPARAAAEAPYLPDVAPPRVSVLVPARDEAEHIAGCLEAVLHQGGVAFEVLVLDDRSCDGTAGVARRFAAADPRVQVLDGLELSPGWLGKPHACQQLADAAAGEVLVFLDADVVLAPGGLAATVALLDAAVQPPADRLVARAAARFGNARPPVAERQQARTATPLDAAGEPGDDERGARLDLVCPYPRQLADGIGPRLVQPLLQWSWLTFLPLRLAERSPRPSLCAANGQLLACRAESYRAAGGHAAVRDQVLEDVALARVFKAVGRRVAMADGTQIATCRMYAGWPELRDGYAKSLWAAFGSPAGATAVMALLAWLYVVPPAAAVTGLVRGRPRAAVPGLAGYAAAVGGRVIVAHTMGGRRLDGLAHPGSIAALAWLVAASWRRKRAGRLVWKGRRLG